MRRASCISLQLGRLQSTTRPVLVKSLVWSSTDLPRLDTGQKRSTVVRWSLWSEPFSSPSSLLPCLCSSLVNLSAVFLGAYSVSQLARSYIDHIRDLVYCIRCRSLPTGLERVSCVFLPPRLHSLTIISYLTSFVNMCWGFGLFLAAGVVRASITVDSQWGWRLPYMLQWIWPVPLFFAALAGPESRSKISV